MAGEIKVEGAQSLDRAFSILRIVGARSRTGIGLMEVIALSGLPKPTVHRILKSLESNGLVEQANDRLYYLGSEAYLLGVQSAERFGIHRLAMPSLRHLAEISNDTAFVSVPLNEHAICLERVEGSYPIRTHVLQAGDRHPLGIGAGSLAILAAMPDEEVERILRALTPELDEHYKTYSPEFLREAVLEARSAGFAFNPGRLLAGSWAIGAAVMGPDGRCMGALSISAIESRLDEARRAELAPILMKEAEALAKRLARPQPNAPLASRPSLNQRRIS